MSICHPQQPMSSASWRPYADTSRAECGVETVVIPRLGLGHGAREIGMAGPATLDTADEFRQRVARDLFIMPRELGLGFPRVSLETRTFVPKACRVRSSHSDVEFLALLLGGN